MIKIYKLTKSYFNFTLIYLGRLVVLKYRWMLAEQSI